MPFGSAPFLTDVEIAWNSSPFHQCGACYSRWETGPWPSRHHRLLWQTHSEATEGLGYLNALHLYAGGVGGWSFAQAFMHEQFAMNIRTLAAVDNEPTAMKYWCKNHKAIFLHELMDVSRLLDTTQPFGVLAEVAPRTVAYILAHTSVNLITASPPCQAWTHGGKRKGLLDDNGLQLLNLLAVLRVSQTPWVALENVDGLRTHAHWPMIAQAIIFAGYRFVWEGISDLAQVLPMTRKRYLALLVRDDLPYSQLRMEHKLPTWPGTLFSRWIWPIALPEDHISSLVLNPEELAIYADPAFGRGHNAQQVLQNRTVNGHQILASAMARYSAQHEVNGTWLQTRGIYAQLVPHGEPFECHPNQLRFLSAAEYLMAMGVTHEVQVPADNRAAHALTGNSISVLHVYHVLCNFQRYFSGAGTQPFEIVVQKFLAVRLHARNSEIIMTEGLLVIRPDQQFRCVPSSAVSGTMRRNHTHCHNCNPAGRYTQVSRY